METSKGRHHDAPHRAGHGELRAQWRSLPMMEEEGNAAALGFY
jgi:hypothetical protein